MKSGFTVPICISLVMASIFVGACKQETGDGTPSRIVCSGNISGLVSLVENGFDVDTELPTGHTPLTLLLDSAPCEESFAKVKFLAVRGADVNKKDMRGYYPISLAAYFGSPELVEILLQHKANPNVLDPAGQNPLMGIYDDGSDIDVKIAKLLVAAGIDVNFVDRNGRSVLDVARNRPYPDLVKYLEGLNK